MNSPWTMWQAKATRAHVTPFRILLKTGLRDNRAACVRVTALLRDHGGHSRLLVLCAIIQMQTEPIGCRLDSQDGFVGLPDGDHRSATPLEVPIVLFISLSRIHNLVANALHTTNPQDPFSGAEFVPILKVASKRFPASRIC